MTIDELVASIPSSEAKLRTNLAGVIEEWKSGDHDVHHLGSTVDRWLGNVWFETDTVHEAFFQHWSRFKEESIEAIGGMTVNERLFVFGLVQHWDEASGAKQTQIRRKLHAPA